MVGNNISKFIEGNKRINEIMINLSKRKKGQNKTERT